jgi:ABC-2 type transport system permease protein
MATDRVSAKVTVAYYADLYLTYLRNLLKAWTQYRADFAIAMTAALIHDGARVVFLSVIFDNIHQLEGWTFHEIMLIFGLMVITGSLANGFLDVPHRISSYIQRGDMDLLLVRPPALLFQIAGEDGVNLTALGRILVGAAAILVALSELELPWWGVLYLPLAILSGILIKYSVQLLMACLSFWFTNVDSLLSTMAWMNQFGLYPVSIYALPLRILFTWVLPYAMMGFYPAAFLLRGGEYRLYGLLAPPMGFVLFSLSLLVWRASVRRYQSTGS